jgi:hypothetical protein
VASQCCSAFCWALNSLRCNRCSHQSAAAAAALLLRLDPCAAAPLQGAEGAAFLQEAAWEESRGHGGGQAAAKKPCGGRASVGWERLHSRCCVRMHMDRAGGRRFEKKTGCCRNQTCIAARLTCHVCVCAIQGFAASEPLPRRCPCPLLRPAASAGGATESGVCGGPAAAAVYRGGAGRGDSTLCERAPATPRCSAQLQVHRLSRKGRGLQPCAGERIRGRRWILHRCKAPIPMSDDRGAPQSAHARHRTCIWCCFHSYTGAGRQKLLWCLRPDQKGAFTGDWTGWF